MEIEKVVELKSIAESKIDKILEELYNDLSYGFEICINEQRYHYIDGVTKCLYKTEITVKI